MKKRTFPILVALVSCSAVFAASHPPKITIQEALSTAEKAGYTGIRKIELEHGKWEVKGRNTQGKKYEIKINAMTGALTKEKGE